MNNCDKLQKLIADLCVLINTNRNPHSIEFQSWKNKCIIFLANHYGKDSIELEQFKKISFLPMVPTKSGDDISYYQKKYAVAKEFLRALSLGIDDSNTVQKSPKDNHSVFIVHGHDNELKETVARLLEQQGIEAIILHEQPNVGRTIIEKLEYYGNRASSAIILYTPDDTGKSQKEKDYKKRARQNVVFEAGFFSSYLGRNRVITLISDNTLELPGDLSGIVYVNEMWQIKILQELKEIGYDIDLNAVKI